MNMSLARVAALLAASASAATASAAAPKPHIFSILQDDLGFADTGIYADTNAAARAAAAYTPNITALAKDGIVLTHHYVHWHCSPTRRTFLSGRLPIHHGEQLSKVDTDDMDLRWTWLPQKLQQVGYRTHGFGKEHTGFMSVHHLWSNRGFTSSTGSLLTGGNYFYSPVGGGGPRWQDDHPLYNDSAFKDKPANCLEQVKHANSSSAQCVQEYSTALWGQLAMQAVSEHALLAPLYVHLCFQAVHEPYDAPPPGFRGPTVPDFFAAESAVGDCADTEVRVHGISVLFTEY
jgi:arylsulfatase A-like enzyme